MNWYLTKIAFRIICGEGDHTAQFDEQLRLIEAGNEDEAFEKAVAIGVNEQDTFFNEKQQLVQWQFINVLELYRLSELINGAEVYSKINEVDDADEYIAHIHLKAESLQHKSSRRLLKLI